MKKTILKTTLSICLVAGVASCAETETDEPTDNETTSEIVIEEPEAPEEVEEIVEESAFGNLAGLVGSWTVDAATAGVKMDLTFGEDGSFKQVMGTVNGEGTWEMIDDEHVNIVTQNTKGQKWKITELTENGVNLCWNPDNPKPKTIPMQRVK
jgi:hypothetical protein